jgi:beta-D-xylosidase 4
MCSYNAVNRVPTCTSKYLLQTVLCDHWNWTDENHYVLMDCNAANSIMDSHNYAQIFAQAAPVSFNSGTDNVCETAQPKVTAGAYTQALVMEAVLDQALERKYEVLVRLGHFDSADRNPYLAMSWSDVSTPEAQNLARKSTADGIVLLRNDRTLPLRLNTGSKVAMIGVRQTQKLKCKADTVAFLRIYILPFTQWNN